MRRRAVNAMGEREIERCLERLSKNDKYDIDERDFVFIDYQ